MIAGMCTQDVMIQGVLGKGGLDVVIPIWQELRHAFGTELVIEDLVAEADAAGVLLTERGTFRNAFRGSPPTGRNYTVTAMEWFRFRDGRIAERWGARDSASIMRQVQMAETATNG